VLMQDQVDALMRGALAMIDEMNVKRGSR